MVCGSRADGNFADPASAWAGGASRALVDVPWTWLRQVHGSTVVVVERPGANRGDEADAAVTCCAGAGLVVLTADCAPVGLSSPEGVTGVLHAGWRGLMAGVVGATVAAMRALGATGVVAGLGPCIWPHAYRFSEGDLAGLVSVFGPTVRSVDAGGYPALDLPAGVAVALRARRGHARGEGRDLHPLLGRPLVVAGETGRGTPGHRGVEGRRRRARLSAVAA